MSNVRPITLWERVAMATARFFDAPVVGANDPFKQNPWMRDAFGVAHTGGAVVLSAFGAGAVVKPLTDLEASQNLLPDWAKGTSGAPTVVLKPDFVVVVRKSGKVDTLVAPSSVTVDGKRFDGNGYKTGDGLDAKKFSFGYAGPSRVDVVAGSDKVTLTDVDKILFLGGTEGTATTSVKGNDMSDYLFGIDLGGAPVRRKLKKSLSAAVADAQAAAVRAENAGKSAVSAGRRIPKTKAMTQIAGDDGGWLEILGGAVKNLLGVSSAVVRPTSPHDALTEAEADFGTVDILGRSAGWVDILGAEGFIDILGAAQHLEICGASPALTALAARAAASSARLAEAKRRAAQAPTLIAKANQSIARHQATLAKHADKASKAGAQGQAALAKAKDAKAAITDQIARLKKAKIKIGALDAVSMNLAYNDVPGDAVLWPEGKAREPNSVGSWNCFYGGNQSGYSWVADRWAYVPGTTATMVMDLPGATDVQVLDASMKGAVPRSTGPLSSAQLLATGASFGPLVGNPSMPDYAGLRLSKSGKWFWLAEDAPAWATKERDDALALLQKQQDEANAAADAAAQAAADQAAAEQQAEVDAMNAKYDLQQADLARQADLQAQQLQMEDDKLQAQLAAQQQQDEASSASQREKMLLQATQADLDYAQAHPEAHEALMQQAQQGQDGGGQDGGSTPRQSAANPEEGELQREANRGALPPGEEDFFTSMS